MNTHTWGLLSMVPTLIVGACSDDSGTSNDTRGDISQEVAADVTPDVTPDTSEHTTDSVMIEHGDVDPSAANVCGPAPWVRTSVVLSEWSSSPPKPITGAVATFSTCPDKSVVSDDTGALVAYATRAVPLYGKLSAPGYVTMSGPELLFTEDMEGADWLLPEAMLAVVPSWSSDAPTMLVIVSSDPTTEASSPCASAEGVVVSIADHPEAVVTYYEAGAIPLPSTSLTATSAAGVAIVSGLQAGTTVEPVAVKVGCNATFKVTFHTGRYPLENGVLSRAGALLTD